MMVVRSRCIPRWWLLAFAALLSWTSSSRATEEPAEAITFSKHIAPILWENCSACHRPGEVGPFPLVSYQDAAKRAPFLAQITGDRRMPPWKPEPGLLPFHDERRLSAEQVALFARWAADGAPEGDPQDLPEPPKFTQGWQLGPPDLVLKMPQAFRVPADGRDIYRCFVIPLPLDEDRMVSAVEFRPGNRRVVHHAVMFLDSNHAARKIDGGDGQPGYVSFSGPGVVPTGGLGVWVPGTMPRHLPAGMAKYVKRGSDLIVQVHYHPSGKPETDQSTIGIYFAKQPTEKIITGIAVTQPSLVLPPGRARCDVRTRCAPLPVDVSVLGVSPHMHNLGREFRLTAHLPSGAKLPLIWIKDWDFNWQGTYRYATPVRLPKGTVICLHAVYDNSADNPKNPNDPPREVRWGEQSTDEMCLCGVQVFTDNPADLQKIALMPGFELAVGLEGGIPDLHGEEEHHAGSSQLARDLRSTKRARAGGAAAGRFSFPPEGIPIFKDRARLLIPYDRDKNGRLTRQEMSEMTEPMKAYVLKRYWATR